jgi:hypothetical protein
MAGLNMSWTQETWMPNSATTAGEHDRIQSDLWTLRQLRDEIRHVSIDDLAWLRGRNVKLFEIMVQLTSLVKVSDDANAELAKLAP